MTVEQVFAELLTTFPKMANDGKLFFDHIEVQDGQEIVPPYAVVREIRQDPFCADDTVYYLTIRHVVELFTVKYDNALISKFKRFFNDRAIPFTLSSGWEDDLDCYATAFEMQLDPSEVES